jgi:hypothetical protein
VTIRKKRKKKKRHTQEGAHEKMHTNAEKAQVKKKIKK